MKTLTFIGNGNMAQAIIKGIIGKYEIEVFGRNSASLEALQRALPTIRIGTIDDHFSIEGKNIILCVKPTSLPSLTPKLHGVANELYSILAGTTLATLQEGIKTRAIIRAMPNIAASFQKSMTTLTGDQSLKDEAIAIFEAIGSTLWLGSEKEIDIATAVAGSGPAFLALIAEALCDGAVKNGLSRTHATTLVRGLFDGFTPLLQANHPALIKDMVMSPGGTTASGYAMMEHRGVRNGMIEAIDAAYLKACELGKK